ncbi:MAG: SDR family NAD(P)-dependent oxidoreductase, partial [Myxococcota bacterium]
MNRHLLHGLDLLAELSVVGSFSRYGYRLRQRGFSPHDLDMDLARGVYVVTGATSGIGLATAQRLLDLRATVVIVGRSAKRLTEASLHLGGRALVEQADLSDLEQVNALADRLLRQFDSLQGLVHNAGLLVDERVITPQGHEQAFATHVLAPYLLTQRLLPHLAASPHGRVVFVSSGGMYTQRLDLERCQALHGAYDGVVAYA